MDRGGVAGAGDGIGECPPFFGEIGEGSSFPLSLSVSRVLLSPQQNSYSPVQASRPSKLGMQDSSHEPTYRSNTKCPKSP